MVDDPPDWMKAEAPNGEMFYTHAVTGQVMWQHPHDYTYQQKCVSWTQSTRWAPLGLLTLHAARASPCMLPVPLAYPEAIPDRIS